MGLEVSNFEENKEKHAKVIRAGIIHIENEKANRKIERIIEEAAKIPILLETEKSEINKVFDDKISHYKKLLLSSDRSLNREMLEETIEKYKKDKIVFNKEILSLQKEMKELIQNKTFEDKLNSIINKYK